MQIQVSGKKMDVGEALTTHVRDRLEKGVSKYFEQAITADVVFCKEAAHLVRADILVNEGTGNGMIVKGRAEEPDAYVAFDSAAERIEKQLRRYKRKLRNHHSAKKISELSKKELELLSGKKYVISQQDEEGEEDAPVIVAEKPTAIEKISTGEAVMKMDLSDLPALVFINSKTGFLDVVYHRKDGHISWVSTGVKAK